MATRKPLILVTNDDGVYAPGIFALQQAMRELGEAVVVAPESERSAVGHALTISDPLHLRRIIDCKISTVEYYIFKRKQLILEF